MRKVRIIKSLLCIFILFFAVGTLCKPIQVNASWINRGESGIYGNGSIGTSTDEEDGEAAEEENDDGTNLILDTVEHALRYILLRVGRFLFNIIDFIGASLDKLIYGRLLTDPPLFTFDLGPGNIWGIVSAAIYQVLRGLVILGCVVIFMGRIAFASWRRGSFARSSLIEALSGLMIGLLLLILMPYLLDVAIFIRDCILYLIGTDGASKLFGTDENSLSIISVLAASANESLVSAIAYDAAVILNLYFIMGYIGVALSMSLNFILFPFVVIKMYFDRQVLQNWVWEQVTCLLVPVMDAVLIMIPSYMGTAGSETVGLANGIAVVYLQLFTCYCIIPAREQARIILGLRTNPLEGTGLSAATFLGMKAAKKISDAHKENQEEKKNAAKDLENAKKEGDLAALEKEMGQEESGGKGLQPADDVMGYANGHGNGQESENQNQDDGSPLGQEQTYASGMEANLDSEEAKWKEKAEQDKEVRRKAARLEEIADQMEEGNDRLQELDDADDEVMNDDTLSEDEKIKRIAENQARRTKLEREMGALSDERDEINGDMENLDTRMLDARKKRDALFDKYDEIEDDATMDPQAKKQALHNLSKQIDAVDEEIANLDSQRQLESVMQQRADLAKEPEMLRREQGELKTQAGQMMQNREQLMRKKAQLTQEQGQYTASDERYQEIGAQIAELDKGIMANDKKIGANAARQHSIQNVLQEQENSLRDRQAYNLHERVNAQSEYDAAKASLDTLKAAEKADGISGHRRRQIEKEIGEQESIMQKASGRLAELATEDRRIGQKLREISPDLHSYTPEQLKQAKRGQQVRRASLQHEIAQMEEQLAMDPEHSSDYRGQIARLKSEAADANLRAAKIDQMMDSLSSGSGAGSGGRGSGRTSVSDEYDRKRRAIMERYANVDNFEEPGFQDISHERKAELYRERAIQNTRLRRGRTVGGTVGAMTGALMGIWLGSTGVLMGGMAGGSIGSAGGSRIAETINMEKAVASGIIPTDYADVPLDVHVSADLRDNSTLGQQRTIERVRADFSEALSSGQFEQLYREQVVGQNIVEKQMRILMQENGITKANYAQNREKLQTLLNNSVYENTRSVEQQIIENCAGQEYARLSPKVKERLMAEVLMPRQSFEDNFVKNFTRLPDEWQPEFEDYLHG